MALFSSSLMAGLVVVSFSTGGTGVVIVTVVGFVMDDVVMMDDGSILSSRVDFSSKVGISVVNISVILVLVTVSVSRQPEVLNSSSPLVWTVVPGWAPLPTWDSSNSAVGLVTKVTSTSISPVTLLFSVSVLTAVFCIASSIMDKVTLGLEVWVVMANGVGVFGSVKKLLGVFMGTFGVVASTLVPVVRIVCSQVLYSVYEMLSVVALVSVNVADAGLVVVIVKPWFLVLNLGVVSG